MAKKLIPLTVEDQTELESRGIHTELAVELGWTSLENRKGWVAIPFWRNGKRVNTKYRRITKAAEGHNFEQDKGGEQCFFNLAALEAVQNLPVAELCNTSIVITEGEFDAITALQCGYAAVSVPSGAPAKETGVSEVEGGVSGRVVADDPKDTPRFKFLGDFPKYVIAILAVDDDPAGQVLRQELALRLGWHRCKWVQYPKGCKDLNDVFRKFGQRGVDMVLREKARFMNTGGLFRMSELPAQPEVRAYACGIGNVSDMIKLRPGDISVFTGIPSMGKTTFVSALACNMARLYGWNTCFGSFEQSPRGDHLRALRTYHLGKKRLDHNGVEQWSATEIAEADRWIDQYFTFIVPDVNTDDLVTLKWVLDRARAAITQHGANMLVIDPWNELDHDRPQGMSLTEYTGFAIKQFKRLAREYMIHVSIVAHPAKMEKNREGGYSIPTLYDISDSSHWYNKSDLGVIIHRISGEKEGQHATLVRVAKVRYWNVIGRTGDRLLEYLPHREMYIDVIDFQPKRRPEHRKSAGKKSEAETEQQDLLAQK